MFESEIAELDAAGTLAATADAHAVRTRADLELIELSLRFADLHPDPATIPGHVSLPGGERGWVCGGPGCPGFAEFAAAEFGAAIGRSAGSAAAFMGQSLALRHRFPLILAMVRSGHGEPWKARTIATACLALSVQAAAIVDRRVAPIIDSVTPIQLDKIVRAAIQQADPEAARATADAKAKERGVWAGKVDEHGTTSLTIRAATGAVIRFRTTLRQIADALAELGDTDPLPERMARAVGIISDPALTHELLTIARHLTKTNPHTADADTVDSTRSGRTAVQPTGPSPDTKTGADTELDEDPATEPSSTPNTGTNADEDTEADAETADPETVWFSSDEPSDEADREPPHPGNPIHDTPFGPFGDRPWRPSHPFGRPDPSPPGDHDTRPGGPASVAMDAAARQELARKVAAIRHNAYSQGLGVTGHRPARTTLYVHITDQTLLAGEGVTRVEHFGPVFTNRLEELLGHGQIIIKPVIDLNDNKINVNAYEVPSRIRERVKLTYPVEQFPYGAAETTDSTDLDHTIPYDFTATGPPGQTSLSNLAPLRRYSHRIKTLGGWKAQRRTSNALEWMTPHGLKFLVDHQGTHRISDPP